MPANHTYAELLRANHYMQKAADSFYFQCTTRTVQESKLFPVNPYIALAACVGAGLWGIEKNLKLEDAPLAGDAAKAAKIPRLPRNLMHATENLKRSKIARELFGETFVDHFVRTREWEWRQYQDAVTDWELKRYFEII